MINCGASRISKRWVSRISCRTYATAAAIGLAGSLNRRGEPCVVDADLAIQIALLVNELVTNACKTRLP
jgi:two-component sensor histidine kinase